MPEPARGWNSVRTKLAFVEQISVPEAAGQSAGQPGSPGPDNNTR